jgi:hypothetical protein
MWDPLRAKFLDHVDEINADLKARGLPLLGEEEAPVVKPLLNGHAGGVNGEKPVNGFHE